MRILVTEDEVGGAADRRAVRFGCGSTAMAGAQQVSPTGDQYDNELTQLSGCRAARLWRFGSASASSLGGNVGPLPFTGFDVIAMAAVALAVTGLGLGLQRGSQARSVGLGS